MKVTIIGTGYVGLVAGTCFADMGHDVICVDNDEKKVNQLLDGKVPIYEPKLDHLVKRNLSEKRLFFTSDIGDAIKKSQIIFIAVGTPSSADGSSDMQYVLAVAKSIGEHINEYKVIVDKSTVPIGTAEKVKATIQQYTNIEFDVISNPEFLKEGVAIDDFLKPDRVVIGYDSEKAKQLMEELYAPFTRNNHPVIFMDIESAEMTKYAANAMLATRISFMNEIALLCDKVGADVRSVRKGMGSDKRIGQSFLYPGIGYGGSCFPKDVKALIKTAKDNALPFKLLQAVEEVNEDQKNYLAECVKDYFKGQLKGKTFGVWGLAFKPETDDVREAPAINIIKYLLKLGAKVKVSDPEALENVKILFSKEGIQEGAEIEYHKDRYAAVESVDGLIVCTEWSEYRVPDFDKLRSIMKHSVIFDGRNLFINQATKAGFEYFCIGANNINRK